VLVCESKASGRFYVPSLFHEKKCVQFFLSVRNNALRLAKPNSMKTRQTFIFCLAILFFQSVSFSQIMISPTPGKIDSSAMLEVRSSNRGFLPSRMSSQQRKSIKNPAPGLMVFDTTKQLFYGYTKGSGWRPFLMGYDTAGISDAFSPVSIIDNSPGDQLGSVVAISGNVAVATAPTDDIGGNVDQGSLYVFRKQNEVWTNTQKLTAPDGAAGDQFGTSVAMTDQYVFVSALFDDVGENADQGSVYVFSIQNEIVSYQQKLTGSTAAANDLFGYYIAAQNNQLFIGAPYDDITVNMDQGSVYSFKLASGTWTESQKIIQDSAAASEDYFGFGISIDSGMVAIGGHINTGGNYGYGQNAVFIYESISGTWQRRQKIEQPETNSKADAFGYNTTLKNGILTIGAWLNNNGSKDRGTAYVFKKTGNAWNYTQKLSPADEYVGDTYGDYFGTCMRLDDKYMISGSGYEDIATGLIDRGAFYLYELVNDQWVQRKKVDAPTPVSLDLFGHALGIQGGNIIVGSASKNNSTGKIYFYTIDD
jgi:hypothetical protein